jgi:hypothetical protein
VHADFYEKALFVKPTWRLLCGRGATAYAVRAMLLSALSVSLLFGGSVHYEIRLDSGSTKVLRSSDRSLFLSDRPSPYAQSPSLEIRSAIGQAVAHPPLYLGIAAVLPDLHLLSTSASLLHLSLSRLLPLAPMRVVEWLIDLSCYPQTVQKHTKLSRYGHHRSLLGVLGSPRSYLLSVAP